METNAEKVENSIELQKQDCEKVAKEAFNQLLAAYRQIIDGISHDHFKILDKTIAKETNKVFDVQRAGNVFKEHLYESIKNKFTNMWKEHDMNGKLTMLEFAKRNNVIAENWRPSGKNVEKQVRPHVMRELQKQRELLQRQIDFQNQQISSIIPQLEEARKIFKNQIEKRSQIIIQINQDIAKMKEAENRIQNSIEQTQIIEDDDDDEDSNLLS